MGGEDRICFFDESRKVVMCGRALPLQGFSVALRKYFNGTIVLLRRAASISLGWEKRCIKTIKREFAWLTRLVPNLTGTDQQHGTMRGIQRAFIGHHWC